MMTNEDIVISGISGRYPECNNVEELAKALFEGVDLVTQDDRRFPIGIMGIPPRCGKIPELDKFDAGFFGIHTKQAKFMDPRHRILLETTFECIIDAGFNPQELRGSKTGVYVGIGMFTNREKMMEQEDTHGYSNLGLILSLAANRISYCFDLKGKSYSLDAACSSSLYCLTNAVEDIASGKVDAAIVCATHLLFHPKMSAGYSKLNVLSQDGKCKVFSSKRDGFVRSEAIVSILLQKKSASRRLYATVVGAASNVDGYKTEGIAFPSSEMQFKLMQEVYLKQGVNSDDVTYVEAHGTGTPVGDRLELQAIVNMFCDSRKTPLIVGSVKSNMGHTETASGLCSISKVLIAMEYGAIPANLHGDHLDTDLQGIKENKVKVLTENLPWDKRIAAINAFGLGGANAHVVLKAHNKEKSRIFRDTKYRLVHVSGRTEEAVNHFLNEIENNNTDEEFLALVDEVHKFNCEGHAFRGFTILGGKQDRRISRYTKKKPIWFIYPGMGSEWIGMGRDLLFNEVFRNTIRRCANALKPYNVNLNKILANPDPDVFDDCVNWFSAITAVEVGMTDLLYSLGIEPDGIVGHSLGEIACSYADGQVTAEEAVVLAYARGYATKCVELPAGAMAVVGLSKDKCIELLPDDIFIACQNGKNSFTIAGPEQSVLLFINELTLQGIFAKKLNSGGVAYHSKYVKDAVPYLYDFVKKISTSKLRSSKWMSTSVGDHQKNESWTRYNCAEYHVNNFSNPVLFEKVYNCIPDDAIVIEVAAHGTLQGLLKRELNSNVTILSLANKNSLDNEEWFLSAIGKIYLAGGQPNLTNFYKSVTYPVSRGTKMLGPLVKWDHSASWFVPLWTHKDSIGRIIPVNTSDEEYAYLTGHSIDGKVSMPGAGYLVLVWRTLAHLHLREIDNFPVIIENVKFKRVTVLPPDTEVQFLVNIMKHSGDFEISESGSVVCTGKIKAMKDVTSAFNNANCPEVETENCLLLNSEDFYKECRLRGYTYEEYFKAIEEYDIKNLRGKIKWHNNFVSFFDAMLQMTLIFETERVFLLLDNIERIVIDPQHHLKLATKKVLPVYFNKNLNIIKSGAIEISGVVSSKVTRRKKLEEDLLVEDYKFIPYEISYNDEIDLETCLIIAVQIILQNQLGFLKFIKICDASGTGSTKLMETLKTSLNRQSFVETEYYKYNRNNEEATFDAIILTDSLVEETSMNSVINSLNPTGIILFQGDINKIALGDLKIVFRATLPKTTVYLLKPQFKLSSEYSVVRVNNFEFNWLEIVKSKIEKGGNGNIYLVQDGDTSGLVGLTKYLVTELSETRLRCILIQNNDSEMFSLNGRQYRDQLEKDLTVNVWRDGKWGTYVHIPFRKADNKEVADASTHILTVGDLSTLHWIEKSPTYTKKHCNSEKVYVHYCALNSRDLMVATGKLHLDQGNEPTISDTSLGIEYSGIAESEKRVMGLVEFEGLGLQVQSDPELTWVVPGEWSLEEAATVPFAYAMCYYAMLVRGQMQVEESILIHSATEDIGLSAIAIALSMRCTVFATVENQDKKDYLKKLYPQLNYENIGYSLDGSFRNIVIETTKGNGVDLVLTSSMNNLQNELLACIALRGRFLEIGKMRNYDSISSIILHKNASFHSISFQNLFHKRVKYQIYDLLVTGIKCGVVKPLSRTTFKEGEIPVAFRCFGNNKGKVLVELRKENPGIVGPFSRTISAIPKIFFNSTKSYILIGALEGVGLELTDWMIKRGAKNLILNSKRQISNGYQSYCLKKWSKWNGISVKINTDDSATLEGAESLVAFAKTLGPVGGVFHTSLVVKDDLMQDEIGDMFEGVFKSKILSGWNMDIVTRAECPALDYFVVFSSVVYGRGNAGQFDSKMGNWALEGLCEKRRNDNFPALAIQWGAIEEVGLAIECKTKDKLGEKLVPQSISSCMEVLEKFMLQNSVIGSSTVLVNKNKLTTKVKNKTPTDAVATIMGIRSLDSVDKTSTLLQLGLDSLIAAEIKQTLYKLFNLNFNINQIWDLTFNKLLTVSDPKNKMSISTKNILSEEIYEATAMLPKDSIISMNSKEAGSKIVFLIHHINGGVDVLRSIAHLKAQVYGLQCTRDVDFDDLEEYARYFIGIIRMKQPQGPYILCGYSFGATVALEIGLQLEKSGEVVHIVMIDGSPAYFTRNFEVIYEQQERSLNKFKTAILIKFLSAFTLLDQQKVKAKLTQMEGWDEQLQFAGRLVSEGTGLDKEHVKISAEKFYKRCLAGLKYKPESMFTGKIVLIRADTNGVLLSKDYELRKICKQEVKVLILKGNHETILFGENASIITNEINAFML